MGYFEEFLGKTKDFMVTAYKKTSNAVSVEKQKFDVTSIKVKRDNDFKDLGKIYFEMLQNSQEIPEQAKDLYDSIILKNEQMAKINAEIQSAKNKRVCPNCNANIDINSVYCNVCGEKVTFGTEE